MSEISVQEALIAKLYNSILETADYVCLALANNNVVELSRHDPSFEEIKTLCEEILKAIKVHSPSDERISQVEEVITILREIIGAIPAHDNPMLVDCTCHLEQFLEMHVRKTQ